MNWNHVNVQQCLEFMGAQNGDPLSILIVGCGDKCQDVMAFDELLSGNCTIVGVDILDSTGEEFKRNNCIYVKASVEALPFIHGQFDLAYSFATFEHVRELRQGWQQMLNSLKKGGLLWSISAPLWFTPWGHHKRDLFEEEKWVHLRFPDAASLIQHCHSRGMHEWDGIAIEHHCRYMLNELYFNMHSSFFYEKSALDLVDCNVIRNDFDSYGEEELLGNEDLLTLGFPKEDLLRSTHRLIAQKL